MYYLYHFEQFKRRNPEKFNSLTNSVLADLAEFEKAVNTTDKKLQKTCLLKTGLHGEPNFLSSNNLIE